MMETPGISLSIVIVNWNVRGLLRRCIETVEANAGSLPVEVIVVDNASADGSAEMVRREFPGVRLIASGENLGYSGGNNLGMASAAGRYALILNPDTEIAGNALAQMVAHMEAHPEVGAVGPALYYADGTPQPSRRRFPTPATPFWESTLLERLFPANRHARAYRMLDVPVGDSPQRVDWLVGAAVMVRREAWEEVGPLDEGFFMYFEELDWFRRLADTGRWEAHYLPGAKITHHEGKSSEQVAAARAIRFERSKIRYCRKHLGRGWAQAVRAFVLAGYGWELAAESLKWLVGHRRELRRERVSAYLGVLKSGLR